VRKTKIYWLSQIIGWFTYGILQLFLYAASAPSIDKMFLVGEGLQVLFYIFSTHALRWIIIRYRWLLFPWHQLFPRVLVAVVAFSGFNYFFLLMVSYLMGTLREMDTDGFTIFIQMIGGAVVYLLWSMIYFTYLYFERYNKSLQYEAALRETELNNLKSQLNPHFIFNALNSIRALVDENPNKSKEAITQLSHILRNSLNTDRQKLVPFAEELRTVQDYLGLESIRYEERLKTSFDICEESNRYLIPPLMLQTLVENGIKHGIAKLKRGGAIGIKTFAEQDKLVIEIRNSGHLDKKEVERWGVGLRNTCKRLELIYADEATFEIMNEDDQTVLTKVTLPYEGNHN
jgi:two-component system, LytTR family, sensor kinase